MGIGTAIRHRLGRFEQPAAEAYRGAFINLDDLMREAQASWGVAHSEPPARILEVGCGDGYCATRITAAFPTSQYVGIDPAETVGRLYTGRTERAEIVRQTTTELLADNPDPFDLIFITDVLHHINPVLRRSVLGEVRDLLAPEGQVLVKEWTVGRPVIGQLAYWADRYVSGDTETSFMDESGLREVLAAAVPELHISRTSTVRPWRENILLTLEHREPHRGT